MRGSVRRAARCHRHRPGRHAREHADRGVQPLLHGHARGDGHRGPDAGADRGPHRGATQTSTPGDPTQTPESSTPYPSPVKTVVSATPTATGTATGTPTPDSLGVTAGGSKGSTKARKRRARKNVKDEAQTVADCLADVEEKTKQAVKKTVTLESTTGASGGGLGDPVTPMPRRTPRRRPPPPTASCSRLRLPTTGPPSPSATATVRPPRTTRPTPRHPGRGPDRRAELLHRQVPHPALPAADLPGRRHPVRRPLGGARGDQRDRDRLRPQPQRLLRRRAGLDAVHARRPGRPTASTPTTTASRTPTTRSTRSSPPPATCAPPAPRRTSARRSSPTTTPTGTSTPSSCAPALIGGLPVELRRLAHRPDPGPLPRRTPRRRYAGDLSSASAKPRKAEQGNAAYVGRVRTPSRRGIDIFARRGAAVDRRQRRRDRPRSARPSASAASSSSRTSTATPTPTRSLGKVAETYPAPARAPSVTKARDRAASSTLPKRRQAAAPTTAASADAAATPASGRRRRGRARAATAAARGAAAAGAPPRSACSPTRPARTRRDAGGDEPARPRPPTSPIVTATSLRLDPQATTCAKPLEQGRARHRRHHPRPHRRRRRRRRPAPALRDPPRRPRRPAHRPQADPRRLEAARVDRDLPRRGQEPVLRRRRRAALDRPDPADEQGGARSAACSPTRASRSTSAAARDIRTGQIDRRVLATLEYLAASGLRPTVTSLQLRPRLLHRVGQRLRSTPRATRSTSPRSTASRSLGHQGKGSITDIDDPAPAHPAGHDEARPDHHPDDLRRARTTRSRWATTTTTSTSASSRSTARTPRRARRVNARRSSPSSGSS